jgi:hypothetical protein
VAKSKIQGWRDHAALEIRDALKDAPPGSTDAELWTIASKAYPYSQRKGFVYNTWREQLHAEIAARRRRAAWRGDA